MFDAAPVGLIDRVDALLADIKALGSVDTAQCSADDLASAAVRLHQAQAAVDAHAARVDRALEVSGRWRADGYRSAKVWLADRTGGDARSCGRSLRLGRVAAEMREAGAAWETGEITSDHLRRLAAARNPRTARQLSADEHRLVDQAKLLAFAEFDRLMTYWAMHADPDGADQDAAAQRDARNVWLAETVAGMFAGQTNLDPVSGAIVAAELDRLERALFEADWADAKARLGRTPTVADLARTAAQRRADALVEMAKRSAAMPPDARQARVLVSVLVGEGTFRNLCEVETTRRPIPPGAVRDWLNDALFERILFDGPDRVIGVSHRRSFDGARRRALQARDRTRLARLRHPRHRLPRRPRQPRHRRWAHRPDQRPDPLQLPQRAQGHHPRPTRTRRPRPLPPLA